MYFGISLYFQSIYKAELRNRPIFGGSGSDPSNMKQLRLRLRWIINHNFITTIFLFFQCFGAGAARSRPFWLELEPEPKKLRSFGSGSIIKKDEWNQNCNFLKFLIIIVEIIFGVVPKVEHVSVILYQGRK